MLSERAREHGRAFFSGPVVSVSALMLERIESFVVRVAITVGRRATRRRAARGALRSLWGASPILTLPLKVAADRMLGFESHSLVFMTYHVRRDFDFNLRRPLGAVRKLAPVLAPLVERLVLAWAVVRYDVFHFYYDRGIVQPESRFGIRLDELEALRTAGKRVYLYAYGADVRTRERTLALGRWNFCVDCRDIGKYCVCDDGTGSKQMAAMCARVTKPVALGDMLAYVPGARSMHYWPIDLDAVPMGRRHKQDGILTIAHAPNHSHFKGTHHLEAAIERLRTEGHAIEYVKLQGISNSEVIRMFGQADVIADQFIGGAYGYTALEGMATGKPVITYVRSRELVEAPDECPLINATPDTLEEVLRWLLSNRSRLAAIGMQGRAYVERRHSIAAFAGRLASLYLDTAEFPPALSERLRSFHERELQRVEAVPQADSWQHPWIVQ